MFNAKGTGSLATLLNNDDMSHDLLRSHIIQSALVWLLNSIT